MTKSTITRERAQQIFLGNGPEPSASEERELARMALAAMDSEPDCKERKLFCSTDTARMRKAISVSAGTDVAQPYRHAQPAPVVPEEATPDSIEILASGRCRDHVVYQWDEDQRNAAADSWNACRAAMLQELKKSAGTEATCRSNENAQVLTSINPAPDLVSLQKKAESIIGNYPGIPDGYVMVPDDLKEAAADLLATLDDYPEQLVPINRDSSVVRALRAAMLAADPQEVGDA